MPWNQFKSALALRRPEDGREKGFTTTALSNYKTIFVYRQGKVKTWHFRMDSSKTLILDKLGVSYDQFIHYQWDHVLAKHVCSHSGRLNGGSNMLKATHRLCNAPILQLCAHSVSLYASTPAVLLQLYIPDKKSVNLSGAVALGSYFQKHFM